jgi:DNA-binding CsgD family transcriptional regulator
MQQDSHRQSHQSVRQSPRPGARPCRRAVAVRSAPMAGLEPSERDVALVGRERECGEIQRRLDEARVGVSSSLVLRGEAGIGKTALLEHAAMHARGMTVLRAAGVNAESDLAFAGLFGLVRPIIPKLSELFEPHAAALAGALGIAPSDAPDRFFVSAALLGLLAAAADEQPVLCLIDDAQWLDRPSADALVFAARRLGAERVAIMFTARNDEPQRFEAVGLPDLVIDGVDERSAQAILDRDEHLPVASVRRRLLATAAGNPLALLELPAALSDAQRGGREPLPETIPLTPRLEALFAARIGRLPQETQTALLIAAADNSGDCGAILRAASGLGLAADALDHAEQAALIRTDAGRVRFRHPLVRSALYEKAPLSQRQRVHAALAQSLSGVEHADRRVWHQAMAALTRDEDVAVALESSAHRAQRRAGHASAATAFQRAAELTLDESRIAPRLACAARAAWDAGQPDRARELIAGALPRAGAEQRARLLQLRGLIEARCGRMRDAVITLIQAADAGGDRSLKLEILLEATQDAADTGDPASVAEFGARARAISAETRRDEFTKATLTGIATMFAGERVRGRSIVNDALRIAHELDDDPQVQIWAANAASLGFDLGEGLPYAVRATDLARRHGLLSLLPVALEQLGRELWFHSRFDLADAAAQEGHLLSLDIGHGAGWHLTTMAAVESIRGREADARAHLHEVFALVHRSGETLLATMARATLGLLELTIGRPDDAARVLLQITAQERTDVHRVIAVASVPDAVEAVVRAGRPSGALHGALDRLSAWAEDAATDARRSMVARCEALLALRPPGEAFEEAVRLGETLAPFQRARGELLYGEWLRRERRRIEAREHLRAAYELFGALGAVPWEQRAGAELRAAGETTRRRDPSTLDQLTPQEVQIADLVADGLTNREIAAQLFLSPRTIEYHLRKVFSKLGLTSRTELVRRGPSRASA